MTNKNGSTIHKLLKQQRSCYGNFNFEQYNKMCNNVCALKTECYYCTIDRKKPRKITNKNKKLLTKIIELHLNGKSRCEISKQLKINSHKLAYLFKTYINKGAII